MIRFQTIKEKWNWTPIRNCEGRYILRNAPPCLTVEKLLGEQIRVETYHLDRAADPVSVVHLRGGGLISYAKPDGMFVHTLGNQEGFMRKLKQLGIEVPSASR